MRMRPPGDRYDFAIIPTQLYVLCISGVIERQNANRTFERHASSIAGAFEVDGLTFAQLIEKQKRNTFSAK